MNQAKKFRKLKREEKKESQNKEKDINTEVLQAKEKAKVRARDLDHPIVKNLGKEIVKGSINIKSTRNIEKNDTNDHTIPLIHQDPDLDLEENSDHLKGIIISIEIEAAEIQVKKDIKEEKGIRDPKVETITEDIKKAIGKDRVVRLQNNQFIIKSPGQIPNEIAIENVTTGTQEDSLKKLKKKFSRKRKDLRNKRKSVKKKKKESRKSKKSFKKSKKGKKKRRKGLKKRNRGGLMKRIR